MLIELRVRNLALVDDIGLEFRSGFTVLTGETGAGKSIIIDALNAVLGQRVGTGIIRQGETTAFVEAVFDAADAPAALQALDDAGLREADDTVIILSREIARDRSHYRINRRTSTLGVLQEIGCHLVDIHGQHEHQALIHEENHLSFLDSFGGVEHLALRQEYEKHWDRVTTARRALEDLVINERERAQRVDMLRYQVQEIQAAELSPEQEEELTAERSRLQHVEKIREAVYRAIELLDGEIDEGMPALAAVQLAVGELNSVAKVDAEMATLAQELDEAAVVIAETTRTLNHHIDALDADPERLEVIESRLAEIGRLKRKYGDSVVEIIAFGEQAAQELARLENLEARGQELEAELKAARLAAGKTAVVLSDSRQKLASELGQAITTEVAPLGMEAAQFCVELNLVEDQTGIILPDGRAVKASRRGADQCRFLFSANAGEDVRALTQVASGGELSRLMLALKSTCSRGAEVATIVFDEVDTGIGGRVAHSVGDKLRALSATAQVLCVTHLPQIARLGDNHLHVAKQVVDGRTVVRVYPLDDAARVDEIARMLGGNAEDATALKHAKELLNEAKESADRKAQTASSS